MWTWLWGRYHVPQNVFLVNDISDHLPEYYIWNDDTAVSDRNVMYSVSRRLIDDNRMFNFAKQLSAASWNVSEDDVNMTYSNFISVTVPVVTLGN